MDAVQTTGVIPPHALLFDFVHYAKKIKPSVLEKTRRWPLGATMRPDFLHSRFPTSAIVNKPYSPALPPSLASAVRDFTSSDCYRTDLNLFNPSENVHVELGHEAWKALVDITSVNISPTTVGQIPVCTVEHDNEQLMYGRKSKTTGKELDECCYKKDCDALKVRGALGPLQRFLLPSEQEEFDATGAIPEESPSFCLLCIRRDIQACYLAYKSVIMNPMQQLQRSMFVIPPFMNLCDVPGGYNLNNMGVRPESFTSIPVYICGTSGTLQTHYNPATKTWFIDQGGVVFTGQSVQDF